MVKRVKLDDAPKHPRGAPKKYNAKLFPKTAKFLASRGATIAEIADCFSVSTRVLYYWLTQYPELQEAIETGNDVFNPRVERALAERALGYSVDVEELFVINKKLESRIFRKYYPPDVTACIFWLKNRQPERWRDVQRHEIQGNRPQTSEEIHLQLAAEFKDLIEQGLLTLPAPRQMKTINGKR